MLEPGNKVYFDELTAYFKDSEPFLSKKKSFEYCMAEFQVDSKLKSEKQLLLIRLPVQQSQERVLSWDSNCSALTS